MKAMRARMVGIGSYLPEKVLTNDELAQMVDTSDEWIVSRTGMKERRIAHADEHPSDMGFAAAEKALSAAGMTAQEIDLIIVVTMTPDYISPAPPLWSKRNWAQAKRRPWISRLPAPASSTAYLLPRRLSNRALMRMSC